VATTPGRDSAKMEKSEVDSAHNRSHAKPDSEDKRS